MSSYPTLAHLGFKTLTAGWFMITLQYMKVSAHYQERQTVALEKWANKKE